MWFRLLRWFRWRRAAPTVEDLFEETLGLGRLPRDEMHPARNASARQKIASDATARLTAKCDALRASGRWTTEMEAAWYAVADADEADASAEVSALAHLVHEATFSGPSGRDPNATR